MTPDQQQALKELFLAVENLLYEPLNLEKLGKLYIANELCARLGTFV